MDQTQDPGHPATGELAPEVSGRGLGLRSRLLGAILVVALTTVGVGLFGIQRMSVLSDQAQTVYDEGTLPVNAMRELQVDWWTLSANVARAAIPTLPPDTIAKAQRGTLDMTAALAEDIAATSEMPLDPQAKAAFETFATATQTYLTALAQLQQVSVTTRPSPPWARCSRRWPRTRRSSRRPSSRPPRRRPRRPGHRGGREGRLRVRPDAHVDHHRDRSGRLGGPGRSRRPGRDPSGAADPRGPRAGGRG